MLPRRSRLTRRAFPPARTGNRAFSEHFSVVYGPSRAGGAAVVVAKAVAKRATARNLLKRRMQATAGLFARPDRFLVIYAKSGAPALPFGRLTEELTGLLVRALR